MGAPKQKWTTEEESALKAGIHKYGVGKWSTILKDPEFSGVLRSRSNVDLKDKWRNLNCMTNGLGSRHKARVTHKSNKLNSKRDEATSQILMLGKNSNVLYDTPIAGCEETSQDTCSMKQISRLDNLILEAVTKLKEPRGSSRQAIVEYIEENCATPPDLERTLAANLKLLTDTKQLVKVKHKYRIAPRSSTLDSGKDPTLLLTNGKKEYGLEADRDRPVFLTRAQIDSELEKMKNMTARQAASAAAKAVAEAEAAIAEAEAAAKEAEDAEAEAEAAAKEAEDAEAEAEAAHCFAYAAEKALNCNTN